MFLLYLYGKLSCHFFFLNHDFNYKILRVLLYLFYFSISQELLFVNGRHRNWTASNVHLSRATAFPTRLHARSDSDQPVHSLWSVFTVRQNAFWTLGYLQSTLRKLWSGYEDAYECNAVCKETLCLGLIVHLKQLSFSVCWWRDAPWAHHLVLTMLALKYSRWYFDIFIIISQNYVSTFHANCLRRFCMLIVSVCQILFSGKNKNIVITNFVWWALNVSRDEN